jgi:hypothetical protein
MPELDFAKLPNRGWVLLSVTDLGDLAGACQRCGTAIRYEHHCEHPMGVEAVVGCICCGDITQDYERAKRAETELKNLAIARSTFIVSPLWHRKINGNLTRIYRERRITVFAWRSGFKVYAGDVCSKRIYPSIDAAKLAAFNFLFNPRVKVFHREIIPDPR